MFKAIISNDLEKIRKKLQEGYDINLSNSLGETAIFRAVVANSYQIVKSLLEYNPRLDFFYEKKWNILHVACQTFNINPLIINILLNSDIDVNVGDVSGNTALFHCVNNPKPNLIIIENLLKKGAKAEIKNKRGISPIDIIIKREQKEVLELFSKYR